jgi:hypothetical protein
MNPSQKTTHSQTTIHCQQTLNPISEKYNCTPPYTKSRSQWPCSLPLGSWGLRVRSPLTMFVSCLVCCVGSGLSDELITRSVESYRMCVCVYDLETLTVRQRRPEMGCYVTGKKCYTNNNAASPYVGLTHTINRSHLIGQEISSF